MHLLPAFEGHRVTGSFDNPAGFAACLCAGFPFCFYFLAKKKLWIRCITLFGMATIGSAVLLSASRAGMLALAVVCILGLTRRNSERSEESPRLRRKILFGIFLAILITGLYFIKKDSADGRLLIWQCSWEMIKDKPVLGHGTGGFEAGYMNYQAAYFEANPDSKFVMLADNTNHPFNEYIGLLVNYGLAGFLLFSLFVFYLIKFRSSSLRGTTKQSIAYWSLTAIAVFAFFSYPLRYPFVWVVGLLSVSVLLLCENPCKSVLSVSSVCKIRRLFPVLILLLSLVICVKAYNRMAMEMKWCKIAHKSLAGYTEQMLPKYQLLYPKLRNNRLFLYNYAAELNYTGHYEESLPIARECESLWADYDLQMLIADNYQQLKDYTGAERHYRKAAAMCPAKFMPLYLLAKMYDETGRKDEALALAERIVNKAIKIPSASIIAIQREMMQLIEKEKNKDVESRPQENNYEQNNTKTRQGETPDLHTSGITLPP